MLGHKTNSKKNLTILTQDDTTHETIILPITGHPCDIMTKSTHGIHTQPAKGHQTVFMKL